MGEGVETGCYCVDSWEMLVFIWQVKGGDEPVEGSRQDEVVIDAQLVEAPLRNLSGRLSPLLC